ncbi:helix-turn-helix domain-containing protein [Seohaeicola nanhaiensis]|uniref:Helix-turn-helix domain-containing protein n=1 Tax=Seohaeicola nanhaiensis TaxID=1387282 RepID=A0ABV9KEG8_9RHOB
MAIADELEASRRTVYRDITDLIARRVPIQGTAGFGDRQYAASRGRSGILRRTENPRRGRAANEHQPPADPARFTLRAGSRRPPSPPRERRQSSMENPRTWKRPRRKS